MSTTTTTTSTTSSSTRIEMNNNCKSNSGVSRARTNDSTIASQSERGEGGGGGEELKCAPVIIIYRNRMTVVASYGMVLCGAAGSSDELTHQAKYRGKIEKVKFGVPIDEAFAHDIPATLLVLLLKVNKEGPSKKDIWRAPGNQAQVRKLAHVMQSGRLVNIANYSVYTAASVIKKFLQKLPGGILGAESEELLLASVSRRDDADQTRQLFCRMTPDALGISVAPSLFHSCYQERHKVKMDDVRRLRTASEVVALVIKSFGHCSLFPRESYEFYARITGRTLRVDQNWLFTFQYPSRSLSQPEVVVSLETTSATVDNLESEQIGDDDDDENVDGEDDGDDDDDDDENRPGPSTVRPRRHRKRGSSAGLKPRLVHRLSSSVADLGPSTECSDTEVGRSSLLAATTPGRLSRSGAMSADSTRSLTYLDWVHERQMRRMLSRSEWFLSPTPGSSQQQGSSSAAGGGAAGHTTGASRSVDLLVEVSSENDSPAREQPVSDEEEPETKTTTATAVEAEKQSDADCSMNSADELETGGTEKKMIATSEEGGGGGGKMVEQVQQQPQEARRPLQDVTAKHSSSSSTSSCSAGSTSGRHHAPLTGTHSAQSASRHSWSTSASGVVRRRSWRSHYVRPNKSLDGAPPSSSADSGGSGNGQSPAAPQPPGRGGVIRHESVDSSDSIRSAPLVVRCATTHSLPLAARAYGGSSSGVGADDVFLEESTAHPPPPPSSQQQSDAPSTSSTRPAGSSSSSTAAQHRAKRMSMPE